MQLDVILPSMLFYDPITEKIIDYVDGLIDLDACIIRAIGIL